MDKSIGTNEVGGAMGGGGVIHLDSTWDSCLRTTVCNSS